MRLDGGGPQALQSDLAAHGAGPHVALGANDVDVAAYGAGVDLETRRQLDLQIQARIAPIIVIAMTMRVPASAVAFVVGVLAYHTDHDAVRRLGHFGGEAIRRATAAS